MERTVVLPAAGGMAAIQAKNPKDGWFEFNFTVSDAKGNAATLTLQSLQIQQDGAIDSPRWSFAFLNEGKGTLVLPEQRWDDSRRPTRCTMDPRAGYSGPVNVTPAGIKLTIIAVRSRIGAVQ